MRNLRKLTAVVIALALVLTSMTAAFAATDFTAVNGEKAIVLNELGLYSGVSTTEFDPDLDASLTREQGTMLLLKMFGLADEASALTDEEVATALEGYTDADKVSSWAKKAIAYAVSNDIMSGTSTTTVGSAAQITGAQFATLLVKTMGYTVADYKLAVTQLSEINGSKVADEFADVALTRDAAVGYMFGALTAETADKTTIIANLIAENPEIAAKAIAAGLIPAVAATALDVSGAVAINSKVVEVSLGTAATAADVAAATFTVKDSAAKEFKVVSAALAPWSTDGKSVLVTIEADTTAGTLYTLTTGTKSFNFGGRAADTGKPGIVESGVSSTDYNQVTIEFTEAVDINTVTATFAEKYGSKTALNVISKKYDGSNKIVFTTDNQKAYTLYGSVVSGATDLAGNVMDKAESFTFTGTALNTNDQEVKSAKSNNPEEATVEFTVKVDSATIAAANFKVEEAYGSKTVLAVTEARLANKDELAIDGTTALSDTTKLFHVVLTVPGMKNATLYKVTATGVKTLYGKDLKSDKNTATFGGTAKPTDSFAFAVKDAKAESNTSVKIIYDRKVVKADAENIANYAITEAYGTKAALAVKKVELAGDGKTATLTTDAFKTALYTVKVTNIKDIYGNAIKTDSANTVSFSGVAVASKIGSISGIAYVAGSETVIEVTFDQNVGSTKTDVSHYSIDKSIGYPSKAEGGTNANQVKLTIPKLTKGTPYTLTVKGLENADGVAMGSDGVSATFIGKGNTAGKPEIVAVMPTDNQTLKIYFNTEVTDGQIAGAANIWDKDNRTLVAGALSYVHNANVTTSLNGAYAIQDPDNKNALIVRVPTDDAFINTNVDATLKSFKLIGLDTKFAADKNSLIFTYNPDEPTAIVVDGVTALNKRTVRVYFNQPVFGSLISFASINVEKATSSTFNAANNITFTKAVVVPGTANKVYDFSTSADLATRSYWLNNLTVPDVNVISDTEDVYLLGFVFLKDEDSSATGTQHFRQFAGSDAAAGDIKDISIMMTDSKTLVVYFGENMETTGAAINSVLTAANYGLVDKDGNAVTMSNNLTFNGGTDIGEITFNTDTTSDKLYSITIKLNKTIKTVPVNGIYFKVLVTTVANANGTKFVKDGTTAISKQFAVSTAAPAKVKIKEATLVGTTLTIKLDSNVVAGFATPTAFLANFGVKLTNTSGTAIDLAVADISAATLATGTDTITVTLAAAPAVDFPCIIKIISDTLKSSVTDEPTEKDNSITINTAAN